MNDIDDLRVRAYYIWEAAGRPEGDAERHWTQARREAGTTTPTPVQLEADTLADVLSPDNRALLENDVLPAYLSKRRWFAAKNRTIESIRLAEFIDIDDAGALTQIEISIDGHLERYALPLALIWNDSDAPALARELALVDVRGQSRSGVLTDAFFLPEFVRSLLANAHAGTIIGSNETGRLEFMPEPGPGDDLHDAGDIRWLSTEQSNSSVIVGGRIVMKLMRRLQAGVHPEAEMCRFLTRAGYRNASPLLAEIVHEDRDGDSRSMLVLEGFVPNDGDAWTYAIDCLRGALATPGDEPATRFQQLVGIVGQRLGELHAALSKANGDPAFDPEDVQAGDIESWRDAAIEQLESALDVIARHDADPLAARIVQSRQTLVDAVRGARFAQDDASKTRIHGDFHLGQVLWASGDAYIIDFEGEPARPIESRRAKSSPLKDVAGLLRSISYAAAFASKEEGRTDGETALEESVRKAERGFLDAYRKARQNDADASGAEKSASLLSLFLLEKAAYEVCYEAANRPDWIAIPLRGMARALGAFTDALDDGAK